MGMGIGMKRTRFDRASVLLLSGLVGMVTGGFASGLQAQGTGPAVPPASSSGHSYEQTTDDYNRSLSELNRELSKPGPSPETQVDRADYRIGPDDQLDITVLEASELDRAPRVSATGEISLALVGTVRAEGLTTRELETVIEELLRRSYIKDPHVSVQVRDMQSHPVAVFGAVKKPGVFQIRGPKTVIELLSMAEGLDVDAGDTVIVERHGNADELHTKAGLDPPDASAVQDPVVTEPGVKEHGAQGAPYPPSRTNSASTIAIDLKKLLATGDPHLNVLVYPGDVVKVPRAELVYVVGEVAKPGGFELKSNENISVLQAIAFAQGLTHTSASGRTRIIRTDPASGKRQEIPINLNKILAGKTADPMLEPRDIVFVPNSIGRAALVHGLQTALSIGSGVAIYRR
jgi:polysaccharide export outer membrane protein